ncbi:MAG: hypothetical protein AAF547_06435 [Actinomycetota bacterium]
MTLSELFLVGLASFAIGTVVGGSVIFGMFYRHLSRSSGHGPPWRIE